MRTVSANRRLLCIAGLALCSLAVPHDALADTSGRVALVPGAAGGDYADQHGLPRFPATAAEPGVYDLRPYAFYDLAFGDASAASLASYDTVVLWGARWDDPRLSDAARAALDRF